MSHYIDIALQIYIAVFLLMAAIMIRRDSRLGFWLGLNNVALSASFIYRAVQTATGGFPGDREWLIVTRLVVAITLTFAMHALVAATRSRPHRCAECGLMHSGADCIVRPT